MIPLAHSIRKGNGQFIASVDGYSGRHRGPVGEDKIFSANSGRHAQVCACLGNDRTPVNVKCMTHKVR